MTHPEPIFIAGQTATGKSQLTLALAERLEGEIISVDSMQVYRGMDIGTAKASVADRQHVPHHLIDVVDVTTPFDAAQFVSISRKAVLEIQSRGRVPIFCGGTGLYFQAFLEGLDQISSTDLRLRAELERMTLDEQVEELRKNDPEAVQSIDLKNPRRVLRALEIVRLTNKPLSALRMRGKATSSSSDNHAKARSRPPIFFGLERDKEDLWSRIDVRVDWMFQEGLVAETEHLMRQGLLINRTAMQSLGYRQVAEFLQGLRTLSETVTLIKIRTRQFAKRQKTWFKRQEGLRWLRLEPKDPATALTETIAQAYLIRRGEKK